MVRVDASKIRRLGHKCAASERIVGCGPSLTAWQGSTCLALNLLGRINDGRAKMFTRQLDSVHVAQVLPPFTLGMLPFLEVLLTFAVVARRR